MTRYRTDFITLKKNQGSVTFGDNGISKIVGKGTLNIDNGREKVEKVLCVEKFKHRWSRSNQGLIGWLLRVVIPWHVLVENK